MAGRLEKAVRMLMSMHRHPSGFTIWWPGETRDEIIIGAVLAQATSWRNAEMAIESLRADGKLSLKGILECHNLEDKIRHAGFAKRKAAALRMLSEYLLGSMPTRDGLLSIPGIGEETADAILCYAYRKPEFVADAYSRRLAERISGLKLSYKQAKEVYESFLSGWKEMAAAHASIVEFSKQVCRAKPECGNCPLKGICSHAKQLK